MTPHIPVETSVTLSVIALAIGLWLLVPRRTRGAAPHELIPGLPLEYPEWAALPLDRKEARAVLERLDALLMDEDLTDEKLREASEGLLPNAADALRSLLGDPLPWGRCSHVYGLGRCEREKGHPGPCRVTVWPDQQPEREPAPDAPLPFIAFRPEGIAPYVPVPPDEFWNQLKHQLDFDPEERDVFEVKVVEYTPTELDELEEFTGW